MAMGELFTHGFLVGSYPPSAILLTSDYKGGSIVRGHLIGSEDEKGNIEVRYHQVNTKGAFMTGICYSTLEITVEGKIRLYEKWTWTSGNKSIGQSILEETDSTPMDPSETF